MKENNGIPDIIYKYRSWNNEYDKDVFIKQQLYLASPKDFNDPFDCRIPPDYSILNSDENKKEYAFLMAREFQNTDGLDFNECYQNALKRLNAPNILNETSFEKKYFQHQDEYYGLISFSQHWDNIQLWSHYADKHRGYCMGFKTKQLIESERFGAWGKVEYQIDYPSIDPRMNFKSEEDMMYNHFIETHTKSKNWNNESEIRFTKTFWPGYKPEHRLVSFDMNYVSEIYLGLMMEANAKNEIINICKERNFLNVFEIVKIPKSFKVGKMRVEMLK